MGWTCKVCSTDHGGVETSPAPLCYTTPECKKKAAFACEWVDDEVPGWSFRAGDLSTTKSPKNRDDLVTLIAQCSGNIHSAKIGTVVGGIAAKGNCKKVAGLQDASSRIDIQNPGKKGVYNVQYQVGGASLAGVQFVAGDPKGEVLDKLLESYDNGQLAISPSAG